MNTQELICIVCPVGCHLEVIETKEGFNVEGNNCKRGPEYAKKELTQPTRVLTTTVKVKHGLLNRIPVVTQGEIPKSAIFDVMKALNQVVVEAPVVMDEILVENILNTGINVVASRSMSVNKKEESKEVLDTRSMWAS